MGVGFSGSHAIKRVMQGSARAASAAVRWREASSSAMACPPGRRHQTSACRAWTETASLRCRNLRGRRVLLVFSSPSCGPCLTLAPQLEKFHREQSEIAVIMISLGEPKENRAKVKEHGLTFPVLLQQHWEISRSYATFATPVAYLIDGSGIIIHDVAVGTEPILDLMITHGPQNHLMKG